MFYYLYLLLSVSLGAILPPRMPLTYTTAKNLLEFCILNGRPDNSRHSVWGILNHCYIGISWTNFATQNAPYIHHSKNSPRTLYRKRASGQLQTFPMRRFESLICFIICISCYRYLLEQLCRPECPLHTPQQEFSSSFVSAAGVPTAPDTPYGPS